MNLYGLIKVLHILAVTAVISGVVGRALIRARLVRLDDILIVREFVTLEGTSTNGWSCMGRMRRC